MVRGSQDGVADGTSSSLAENPYHFAHIRDASTTCLFPKPKGIFGQKDGEFSSNRNSLINLLYDVWLEGRGQGTFRICFYPLVKSGAEAKELDQKLVIFSSM